MKSLIQYINESKYHFSNAAFKSIEDAKKALSEKEIIDIIISEAGKKDHYSLDKKVCDTLFRDFASKFESGVSVALGNEWNSYIKGFYINGNKLMFDVWAGGDSTDEDMPVSYNDFMKSYGSVTIKFPYAKVNVVYDERTRLKIANSLFELMQALVDGQDIFRK